MKKIYFNGNVITVDQNETVAEAILIEDGKIKAVGTNDEILALDKDAEKIDLNKKTVLPGFIDPHGHIVAIAQTLMIVMLGDVTSKEELLERLRKELKENPVEEGKWLIGFGYDNTKFEDGEHPTKLELLERLRKELKENPVEEGKWLIGFGYDNTKFEGGEHPTKFDLDTVSKEIPITVSHASGHLAAVNSRALELYGYCGDDYIVPEGGVVRTVSPDSKEPNGVLEENAILDNGYCGDDYIVPEGGVVRTVSPDSKEPNGVLEENAILDSEKKKVVPSPGFEDVLKAIVRAQKIYASLGVTTTQDASVEEANHYNHMLGACAQNNMLFIDIVGLATQPSTKNLMKNEILKMLRKSC